jgi:hypothetical protein
MEKVVRPKDGDSNADKELGVVTKISVLLFPHSTATLSKPL